MTIGLKTDSEGIIPCIKGFVIGLAIAIASKKGDTIQPGGAQLANQLSFDDQVSATPSYIVSGVSRQKTIAN
ncbi:TPA: hypothetical protein ACGABW_002916, partial [Legionella pneumophila]